MSFSKDKRTGFSNGGFRGRRVNPDGSYPSVERQLGFVGTVDLSAIEATAKLAYRYNGVGDFTEVVIDLTAAGEAPAATTVAEVVTALNLVVGFSGALLAEADTGTGTGTGRLLIKNAVAMVDKTYLELKGDVAIALGFGKYGEATAMGTAFVECYTRSAGFTFGKNVKDGEEIEQESSRGGIDTMVIDAVHRGINPTIGVNEELYELKQMLQGGTWDETTSTYTPPTSDIATAPLCAFEFFIPKFEHGSSHRGDAVSHKVYDVKRLSGREVDVDSSVKTWLTYSFETKATEYVDIDGTLKPAYVERELTVTEAIAMGLVA